MKKFIIINILALIIFNLPTILYQFSHYECTSGMRGELEKNLWRRRAASYKVASNLAMKECRKGSRTPENCSILSCQNFFF